jgi:hypothetical protein
MNGLAEGIQAHGIGSLVVILMLMLLLVLIVAVGHVFSDREGRVARFKRVLIIFGIWTWSIFIISITWSYYLDATDRAAATDFTRQLSDDQTNEGEYVAEYAYLPQHRILLRVYRVAGMSLLAERIYSYPDAVRLTWTADSLIYDTAMDTGGELSLPPALYDKITAHLP